MSHPAAIHAAMAAGREAAAAAAAAAVEAVEAEAAAAAAGASVWPLLLCVPVSLRRLAGNDFPMNFISFDV